MIFQMVAVIVFPLGVRLSTWLTVVAFVVAYGVKRDSRILLAGWAWIWGFEAAFDATALAVGHPARHGAQAFYLILGGFTVAWMTLRERVLPSLPVMLVVAVIWIVWVAGGFPVNLHNATTLDPFAEVANEAAKTLWAVAYLVPLLIPSGPARSSGDAVPGVDFDGRTGDAAAADLGA